MTVRSARLVVSLTVLLASVAVGAGVSLATGSGWAAAGALPVAVARASSAFDEATGQELLFGGAFPEKNETAVFTNGSWTLLHPATSPTARESAAMAYDPATQQVVLFGGNISGS